MYTLIYTYNLYSNILNSALKSNKRFRSSYVLPLPLPRYFSFQPNSRSLGRIFVSLQASSEFKSKMALA